MKSWQHRTDILEVCSVGKRLAVIGNPVRQSFTVKLCRVGHDCGYDLFMDQFQSCVESETSWDCRTRREGIRGQRVGIHGQRMDGRVDRINITIASCLIGVTLTFSYISRYAYISVYICLYFNNLSILLSWGRQYHVKRVNEKEPKLQLWQMGVRILSLGQIKIGSYGHDLRVLSRSWQIGPVCYDQEHRQRMIGTVWPGLYRWSPLQCTGN